MCTRDTPMHMHARAHTQTVKGAYQIALTRTPRPTTVQKPPPVSFSLLLLLPPATSTAAALMMVATMTKTNSATLHTLCRTHATRHTRTTASRRTSLSPTLHNSMRGTNPPTCCVSPHGQSSSVSGGRPGASGCGACNGARTQGVQRPTTRQKKKGWSAVSFCVRLLSVRAAGRAKDPRVGG
jgi:hypothetical protein